MQRVRARWDCVLVDEFQDLNPVQYRVIRDAGRDHGHVFAVGDDEQSIYSWAGADPRVFLTFRERLRRCRVTIQLARESPLPARDLRASRAS